MRLGAPRLAAIVTAINADPALSGLPKTTQAANDIAAAFNQNAAPDLWVWKSSVTKAEVLEMIHYADASALTAAVRSVLELYLKGEVVPCDRARVRAAFASMFAGSAQNTHTRLEALFKRKALRGEALFTSNSNGGDGTQAAPLDLGKEAEGELSAADIENARGV